jgi:hypothetical protein
MTALASVHGSVNAYTPLTGSRLEAEEELPMRLWLAIRTFWRVLVDTEAASRVLLALPPASSANSAAPIERPRESATPAARSSSGSAPVRNDAITLLATLQRDARLVDIVKEPLDQYNDAQIGAAARDVLRDCGRVLDRLFGLQPVVEQPEGSPIEAPAGYDAGRFRLTGNVHGQPPFQGRLVHPGWQATRCELPRWSGSATAANIVAPVELEIR